MSHNRDRFNSVYAAVFARLAEQYTSDELGVVAEQLASVALEKAAISLIGNIRADRELTGAQLLGRTPDEYRIEKAYERWGKR